MIEKIRFEVNYLLDKLDGLDVYTMCMCVVCCINELNHA